MGILVGAWPGVQQQGEMTRSAMDRIFNLLPPPYRNELFRLINEDNEPFITAEEYETFLTSLVVGCIIAFCVCVTGNQKPPIDLEIRNMSKSFYQNVNLNNIFARKQFCSKQVLTVIGAKQIITDLRKYFSDMDIPPNDICIPLLTGLSRIKITKAITQCSRVFWKLLSDQWWSDYDDALPEHQEESEQLEEKGEDIPIKDDDDNEDNNENVDGHDIEDDEVEFDDEPWDDKDSTKKQPLKYAHDDSNDTAKISDMEDDHIANAARTQIKSSPLVSTSVRTHGPTNSLGLELSTTSIAPKKHDRALSASSALKLENTTKEKANNEKNRKKNKNLRRTQSTGIKESIHEFLERVMSPPILKVLEQQQNPDANVGALYNKAMNLPVQSRYYPVKDSNEHKAEGHSKLSTIDESIKEMVFTKRPLGFSLHDVNGDLIVDGVKKDSPACRKGVKQGWLVISINEETEIDKMYRILFDKNVESLTVVFDTSVISPLPTTTTSANTCTNTSVDSDSRSVVHHSKTQSDSKSKSNSSSSDESTKKRSFDEELPSEFAHEFLEKRNIVKAKPKPITTNTVPMQLSEDKKQFDTSLRTGKDREESVRSDASLDLSPALPLDDLDNMMLPPLILEDMPLKHNGNDIDKAGAISPLESPNQPSLQCPRPQPIPMRVEMQMENDTQPLSNSQPDRQKTTQLALPNSQTTTTNIVQADPIPEIAPVSLTAYDYGFTHSRMILLRKYFCLSYKWKWIVRIILSIWCIVAIFLILQLYHNFCFLFPKNTFFLCFLNSIGIQFDLKEQYNNPYKDEVISQCNVTEKHIQVLNQKQTSEDQFSETMSWIYSGLCSVGIFWFVISPLWILFKTVCMSWQFRDLARQKQGHTLLRAITTTTTPPLTPTARQKGDETIALPNNSGQTQIEITASPPRKVTGTETNTNTTSAQTHTTNTIPSNSTATTISGNVSHSQKESAYNQFTYENYISLMGQIFNVFGEIYLLKDNQNNQE
ncbi:hypothetical protein RFI_02316 [Reticulomyxa filosa]|uniref:PDZ domain-containing protein n=1 Tax=Reticulomyxa filosa TaxID=46433 RepID=X6P9M7_RETFI|nr:hypothetical protein RFI_02316 [Reticulomyxa filosa]|eukprot:ETO34774.1 hypothetical protein RFI_02316 [Reticulomyxa filosa]